jgi:SH3-like domain-containing protein
MVRIFFIILLLITTNVNASPQIQEVDYFASLRSSETNVRSGPGVSYPIKFTLKRRAIPIHVISEYDNWSEVRDFEGETGWIINSLITKKRTLMVRTNSEFINVHKSHNEKSAIIYRLKNNVIGDYIKCLEVEWCAIEVNNKKGWIKKDELFGI